MTENWDLINKKTEEVVELLIKSKLTMISATFGCDDEKNHWQYKIWIPKKHQRSLTK